MGLAIDRAGPLRALRTELTELLKGASRPDGSTNPATRRDNARPLEIEALERILNDAAAADLVAAPLRATKRRLSGVDTCLRLLIDDLVADSNPQRTANTAQMQGLLVDRVVAYALGGGTDAPRDIDQILRTIELPGAEPTGPAYPELKAFTHEIWPAVQADFGHTEPAWWARTEVELTVADPSGRVLVSGRPDVVLGGPPTDRPAVIIELKSGASAHVHNSEVALYALLHTAVYRQRPAATAVWYPGGRLSWQPVTDHLIEAALSRFGAQLQLLVGLACSRDEPDRKPGPWCARCGRNSDCKALAKSQGPGLSESPGSGRQ